MKKTMKKAKKISSSARKSKVPKIARKSKIKHANMTKKKPPGSDKIFLQKMIENLLPQMAEKILRRAQSVGKILKKRKIK